MEHIVANVQGVESSVNHFCETDSPNEIPMLHEGDDNLGRTNSQE